MATSNLANNERDPTKPSAVINDGKMTVWEPLTKKRNGPGLILLMPSSSSSHVKQEEKKSVLDLEAPQLWAEEGFVVVCIYVDEAKGKEEESETVIKSAKQSIEDRKGQTVDPSFEKIAIIAFGPEASKVLTRWFTKELHQTPLVFYGPSPDVVDTLTSRAVEYKATDSKLDILVHLPGTSSSLSSSPIQSHSYPSAKSSYFAIPSSHYHRQSANLAHSRSLSFVKERLGGPFFDLEKIWDEHLLYEFGERALENTMNTMVEEPYVNHIPTMTGGIGRPALTAFYRDHFIFVNPEDTVMELISRTIGKDRIVDEMVASFTHNKEIDWLVPGIKPTGRKVSIPLLAVVCIRGDKLYNEHIYWDQASVLVQLGLLDPNLARTSTLLSNVTTGNENVLRPGFGLPISGMAQTEKLLDGEGKASNEMMKEQYN